MITNLNNPANIPSGVGEVLFIALLEWFDTLQVPYSGTTLITATHTFTNGKGFLKVQATPRKNSVSAKSSGELGLNNLQYEIQSFIAGSYVQQHSLMQALLNKPLVVLIPDTCGDFCHQVGNSDFPAYLKADFGTGTTKDGTKGYAIDTSNYGNSVVLYSGDILLSTYFTLMTDNTDFLVDESGNLILIQ